MKRIPDVIRKKFAWIMILLLGGVLLFVLSEYSLNTKNQTAGNVSEQSADAQELEARLSAIIGEMKGVSDVRVMVALTQGDRRQSMETGSIPEGGTGGTLSSFSARTDPGSDLGGTGNGTARIAGVSVVCRGAADDRIRKKITDLVASTLDLNQNQIFVTE